MSLRLHQSRKCKTNSKLMQSQANNAVNCEGKSREGEKIAEKFICRMILARYCPATALLQSERERERSRAKKIKSLAA